MKDLELKGRLPKLEDGCVIDSWRCNGNVLMCTTCKMPQCYYHMHTPEHMADCSFRINQESETIREMNVVAGVEKKAAEIETKEKILKEQNKKLMLKADESLSNMIKQKSDRDDEERLKGFKKHGSSGL